MYRSQLLFAATLTATFAAALPAQRPGGAPARPAPAPAVAASTAAGVSDFGGGLHAVGRDWRAWFVTRAVVFQPALGKQAERAHTWRTATTTIQRGDTLLLDAATTPAPAWRHDRHSATLPWPGVAERYQARPDGLKQSFVFARPLPGDGDLVVRLAIDSTLARAPGDPLAWRDERGNGVVLGDVVGLDAAGRRCTGMARSTATGVDLVLPGWFVAGATYPLELDPLIGSSVQALASADCDFPDVAYDAYTDSHCVVWTQFFGGGTTGVVGSVFDADTLVLAYAFGVNQPGDEDYVRVTNIAGTGLFVMVWVNFAGNASSICGLAFEPTQVQATSVFTIDGPADVSSPVVSGEATLYDDDFLVAWLDGTYGLLGCSVAIDQNLQVTATPVVQVAGGNVTEPAFSKQGGDPGLHLLCWVDRPPGLPGWVRAQAVDHDFNLLGQGAWVQNTPQNAGFPAVDGDGFRFLVAWEEQETGNLQATDVRGRLLTVGPNGITTTGGLLDLAVYPNDIDFGVDVAILGAKFGIVYASALATAPFFDDCWFRAVSAAGAPIGAELRLDVTPGTSYRYEHAPRLIGRTDGDPGLMAQDGMVVFADQSVATYDSDVGLQPVAAMGQGGAVVDLGSGCGPGGLAAAPEPFALGNTAFTCELYGAQPLAIPFLFLANAGPAIPCGVCSLLNPWAWFFVPNTAGTAIWTTPVPGDASLVGYQLDFQFVSWNVAYVGCPLLPGFATSNIVRATLDY